MGMFDKSDNKTSTKWTISFWNESRNNSKILYKYKCIILDNRNMLKTEEIGNEI